MSNWQWNAGFDYGSTKKFEFENIVVGMTGPFWWAVGCVCLKGDKYEENCECWN